MEVEYSKKFKTGEKRIKDEIPILMEKAFKSIFKEEAINFIRAFQEHIRNDDLGLIDLEEEVIYRKEEKGYEKPDTPLYGAGDEEDDSLINVFQLRELKNGWKCEPRWAKHHEERKDNDPLSLRDLLDIHEYGRTIVRDSDGAYIRIPPRPTVYPTYIEILEKFKSKEKITKEVKKAIVEAINTARENLFEKIIEHSTGLEEEIIVV